MTLAQLFTDAIQFDEPKLAYTIYWASQNGLSMDESFETLKAMQIDWQAVEKLVETNPLAIQQIKLYSHKEGNGFHLVLARNEQEAIGKIYSEIGRVPKRMHDVSHGMDHVLWDHQKKKLEWIRGLKNAALEFPVYVGWLEKE